MSAKCPTHIHAIILGILKSLSTKVTITAAIHLCCFPKTTQTHVVFKSGRKKLARCQIPTAPSNMLPSQITQNTQFVSKRAPRACKCKLRKRCKRICKALKCFKHFLPFCLRGSVVQSKALSKQLFLGGRPCSIAIASVR